MNFWKKQSPITPLLPPVRGQFLQNEPMAGRTWFGVGGPAEILYIPADVDDLAFFMTHRPQAVPLTILAGCSNVLIRDGGLPGITVLIDRTFSTVSFDGDKVTIGAGAKNPEWVKKAMEHGIGGLSFLSGIPGTIGGGVVMNAGAYGGDISQVFLSAEVIDDTGQKRTIGRDDMYFGYRTNVFPRGWIITSVTLQGKKEDPEKIRAQIDELRKKREASQPMGVRTAGSTFKNVENMPAWKLIDSAGCRGMKVGDAQVSEKHTNFLINTGKSTAADIETLGETVRKKVRDICGLELEWEIKRIGVN